MLRNERDSVAKFSHFYNIFLEHIFEQPTVFLTTYIFLNNLHIFEQPTYF